ATSADTIASILVKDPPPLTLLAPEVPERLHWIVSKALRKDRAERYQTATELLSDLKNLRRRLEFEEELERSIPPDASGSVAVRLDSGEAGGGEDAKVSKRISSTSRRAASRRPSRKMITSLAIMPLVNTSSDPNMDYLSDGITETIINTLS